jgi:hypothetical protein
VVITGLRNMRLVLEEHGYVRIHNSGIHSVKGMGIILLGGSSLS